MRKPLDEGSPLEREETDAEDEEGARRALSSALSPRVESSAGGLLSSSAGGLLSPLSPHLTGDAWALGWRERFECWYVGLPIPTREALTNCMGALALHLGSALDASWRAARASVGENTAPLDTSRGAAEPGCEWLSDTFELPVFPELPFPSDRQFRLPPVPELLPNWRRLISLGEIKERRAAEMAAERAAVRAAERAAERAAPSALERAATDEYGRRILVKQWLAGSAASGVAFLGTLTLVLHVQKRRRCQRVRDALEAHLP